MKQHFSLLSLSALVLALLLLCGCTPAADPVPASDAAPAEDAPQAPAPDAAAVPDSAVDNPADSPAAPAEKTVLRMAVWNDPQNGTPITDFVADFNASQDEITIEVAQYQLDDTAVSRRDSADRVYASFFSGDAPDLYLMCSFDENAMRSAGLLADWYPLMDGDGSFSRGDYQEHVWQAMEQGGALYTLVMSFDLFGLCSVNPALCSQLGWTMEDFSAWMAENDGLITQETALEVLLRVGLKDFVNEADNTCQFETDGFDQWLQLLHASPDEAATDAMQLTENDWPRMLFWSQFVGPYMYNRDRLRDAMTLYYVGVPSPAQSGPAIAVRHGFGLSATTEHADACWQFIRWALSEQTQQHYCIELARGCPIRRDVWEQTLDGALLPGDQEGSAFYGQKYAAIVDGERTALPYPALSEQDVAHLRMIVSNASRAVFRYDDVTDIVREEIAAFLAGDKTREECAHLIQQRVSVFLAERQQ